MSVENSKFEVYVVGYSDNMSYINKKYIADILELGKFSKEIHSKIGNYIINKNIDYVILVGNEVKYIKDILEKNNFNLCESIEIADFILSLKEWNNTNDFMLSKDYAIVNYIDIAKSLDDLLSLRDYYQFRESAVN